MISFGVSVDQTDTITTSTYMIFLTETNRKGIQFEYLFTPLIVINSLIKLSFIFLFQFHDILCRIEEYLRFLNFVVNFNFHNLHNT